MTMEGTLIAKLIVEVVAASSVLIAIVLFLRSLREQRADFGRIVDRYTEALKHHTDRDERSHGEISRVIGHNSEMIGRNLEALDRLSDVIGKSNGGGH